MDVSERSSRTKVEGRYVAVIEPDRYKPWLIRPSQSHLADRQQKFLTLVGPLPSYADHGEAGDEHECVINDRLADPGSPVLTGRQVGCISPDANPSHFQPSLQPVDRGGVF